ncbi:PAS domain-containing protein [Hymenobacter busanensis]|uniref:histidine kinase n=1 Tax=Hymenobacter busanensis TaxID=2607656 RepID=A0A7L4ZXA7_9BACT|nr:PAS domain-containing protein [Hymenobacter busanensis]KAA9333449.1 PAS domain-containing protein [Hymenobacter busanensis]QHJ07868.1 PAS domain-containing protein [Hymenobacter busanensis]
MPASFPNPDFELVFNALVVPHVVLSPALVIEAVNDAFCETMGRPAAEWIGQPLEEAFPPNPDGLRVAPWQRSIEEAVRQRRPQTVAPQRYDVQRPDGRYGVRYWKGLVRPLFTPAGDLRHLLVRAEDVTRLVQTEQQGALNRESFQLLARATHDVVWELDVATGRVWYNDTFEQQFGFAAPNDTDTLDFWRQQLHPDDAAQVQAHFDEAMHGTAEVMRLEYRLRRADGSWAEVNNRAYIVRDDEGQPLRLLGAMQDVTAQRTAERALRQSETSFRLLTERVPQMIWTADETGAVDYTNAGWRHFTGRSEADSFGIGWLNAVHPDDHTSTLARWAQCQLTGENPEFIYRLYHAASQEYRWCMVRATAQRNEQGQIVRWVGSITDIHDQQTQRDQQREQDRRLLRQLDQLPLHLVVLHGPEHVVEYASALARQFLTDDSLGQPARQAHPSPGPHLLALFGEVYRTGQPRHLEGIRARPLHAAPDAAPRQLDLSLHPLRDADGVITGVLMSGLDVTDQLLNQRTAVAAVAETQRQQEQFRFLTEFIPQLVWTADAAGQPDYFNQRWTDYTGYQPEPHPAADIWHHVVHPDDWPRWEQRWSRSLATGEYFTLEYRLRSRHGAYRWFLGQALPLRDAGGQVVKWFATDTDIDDSKRTQQRLVQKDRELQQILGQVPAHLCTLLGPEHICGFATPGLLDLFGGRLRVGWPIAETVTELRQQGVLELLNEVFRTGQTALREEYPLDVLTPAGTTARHYLNFTLQALRDERQQVQGLLVFAVDVTDKVRARQQAESLETEVYRRDEQFRTMVEASPYIVFITHPDGRPEYRSPQWYEYIGQPADVMPAQERTDILHPDDLPSSRAAFQEAQRQRVPWQGEVRLRRHDGEYRWHLSRAVPAFEPNGEVHRWYGVTVDIHEQRELQEQLQRREAEFRLLAESIPQLVWVIDAESRPSYFNQRWLDYIGYGLGDFRHEMDYSLIVHPDDLMPCLELFREAMLAGTTCRVEYRLRERSTGLYRWFIGQAVPLHNAQGAVVQWFGTCTDIHEQKELATALAEQNTELRRINQDLDGFVYTASHDLKQPINNMAGIFHELTRSAQFRDPDATKLTAMFERALQQIHGTINDLTELVQVQKARQQVPPEAVDLPQLVAEVLDSIREQLTAAGAEVSADFSAAPTVQFVRPNLQSVLFNLLSNAVRYADPQRPPRIRLWTEHLDGHTILSVQDNGLGIDLERFGPQLFQMFRRFHPHVEGSGMGLYLVHRIVQSHGGHLEVHSRVGEGTTFRIRFAAASAHHLLF